MLLLILFAACLVSCAAQTRMSTKTTSSFTQPLQITDPIDNVVAILQTAVQSYRELNETTVAPFLNKLYDIIHQVRPDLNFTLTVKNITKV